MKQAIAAQPGYDVARVSLGRLQVSARESAAAVDTLSRVAPASALAREARFLLGVALLDVGRYPEAAAVYAALAQDEPDAAVLNNYALGLLRSGGGPAKLKASEVLKQALLEAPGVPEIPFNVGFSLFVEGDFEAAVFWMRSVLRSTPADAHARVVLAWALRRAGHETEADAEWKPFVATAPAYEPLTQPEPNRRFERSLLWEKPLALDEDEWGGPQYAASHLGRADKLTEAGDLDGALRELTQAAYLDPYGERAHVQLARLHRRRGESEKALAELRMALWVKDDPALRVELASLLKELGHTAEAKAEAERALKADPDNEEARVLAGKPPRKK
jgi:tetratricopeptide (TPR) repeat protein